MNKFISGVIAGACVSSVATMMVTNQKDVKHHSKKTIGKTLHNLGDMAENIGK